MKPGGWGNIWCSIAVECVCDLKVLYWIGRNKASAESRTSLTASQPDISGIVQLFEITTFLGFIIKEN